MKWLIEMAPVAIFVVAYFFYPDLPAAWTAAIGEMLFAAEPPSLDSQRIYFGTLVLMLAMVVQCAALAAIGELGRMHKAALALVWLFGGLTLLLQAPAFIKWKPTIFYWGMAIAFAVSARLAGQNLVEKIFASTGIPLTPAAWVRLNDIWVGFFATCGAANLYVAYAFSEAFWVQFKLFGLAIGAPAVFLVIQVWYMSAQAQPKDR